MNLEKRLDVFNSLSNLLLVIIENPIGNHPLEYRKLKAIIHKIQMLILRFLMILQNQLLVRLSS